MKWIDKPNDEQISACFSAGVMLLDNGNPLMGIVNWCGVPWEEDWPDLSTKTLKQDRKNRDDFLVPTYSQNGDYITREQRSREPQGFSSKMVTHWREHV